MMSETRRNARGMVHRQLERARERSGERTKTALLECEHTRRNRRKDTRVRGGSEHGYAASGERRDGVRNCSFAFDIRLIGDVVEQRNARWCEDQLGQGETAHLSGTESREANGHRRRHADSLEGEA